MDRLKLREALSTRTDLVEPVLGIGLMLGAEGVDLLGVLLRLEPHLRVRADDALHAAFLNRPAPLGLCARVATRVGWAAQSVEQDDFLPISGDRTTEAAWLVGPPSVNVNLPPLWVEMIRQDSLLHGRIKSSTMENLETWSSKVNGLMLMATKLQLSDSGLQLAATLAFRDHHARAVAHTLDADQELTMLACLKLSDAFNEHSQEYYQREKTPSYLAACGKRWSSASLLEAEKNVASRLEFSFQHPTPTWFLRACAHVAGPALVGIPGVVDLARFLLDLSLLAHETQKHEASLRAQVVLLLALYFVVGSGQTHQWANATLPSSAMPQWHRVRTKTCGRNQREPAAACLALVARVVLRSRTEWHSAGLRAAEQRHPEAARRQLPKEGLPPNIVDWLLPDPC